MNPRLKRLGNGLMSCVGTAWFGYQALYGEGALRYASILLLIVGAATATGAVLDHFRPRPKRRRAHERILGAEGSRAAGEPTKAQDGP